MITNLSKISIIGGPGTGKTTLANNLGKVLRLPIYNLDNINYLSNWKKRNIQERDKIISTIINNPKWVTDGTYSSTLDIRVKNSDLVIFLNFSKLARLKGILVRYFKNRNKEITEIPGCKERLSIFFVKSALNWDNSKGNLVSNILNKYPNKNILIFKTRKELNNWYQNEFGLQIQV